MAGTADPEGGDLTIGRRKVTEILREVSDEPTTRIKGVVARDLTQILLEQGLRCYPSLEETNTFETIKIFRAGSVFGNLVDLIIHPATRRTTILARCSKRSRGHGPGQHRHPERSRRCPGASESGLPVHPIPWQPMNSPCCVGSERWA